MKNEKRKIKNEKIAVFPFLILISSFLFLTGCPDPFTAYNTTNIPEGKGSFSLTLLPGRTILPSTPDLSDFAVFNLAFTPIGGGSAVDFDRTNATLSTDQIILDPGTYNLVVNAYKNSNKTQAMARGTLDNIIITAGQNTPANVTLETLLVEGTGTFRWDITVPNDVTTATMKIAPANTGGTTEETVTLSTNSYTGNRTLNSGQYNLTINLESPGGTVVWKELLYVYQNLESVLDFEFTEDHFINPNYTVTFDSNEGSNVGEQTVLHGDTVPEPDVAPTKVGYIFDGWYTDNTTFANDWDFDDPVIGDITLYAKWEVADVTGITAAYTGAAVISLLTQLDDLKANLTVTVNYNGGTSEQLDEADYTLSGTLVVGEQTITVSYEGQTDTFAVTVVDADIVVTNTVEWNAAKTFISSGGNNQSYTVYISGDVAVAGSIDNTFGAVTGLSVTLKGNGRLYLSSQGNIIRLTNDNQTLIIDSADLTLQGLKSGQNGSNQNNNTSVVYITGTNVKLELKNGTISGNTFPGSQNNGGGGVYVGGSAIFTMSGGGISGNTVSNEPYGYGGGVYVIGGSATFIMSGGEISGNTASCTIIVTSAYSSGGGVYMYSGTFTMSGGKISDNTATSSSASSSAYSYGGGVYVGGSAIFTMNGGEISGNTSAAGTSYGGGVHVGASGAFHIVTGTVYGSDAYPTTLRNTATSEAALTGSMEYGTLSGETWVSNGNLSSTNNTIIVMNGELFTITAPFWHDGNAVSITAPTVSFPAGQTVTAQGWQISDTESGGYANYTLPVTANLSDNGKYLRYYATSSDGFTIYSNVVNITVFDINNKVVVTNTDKWNAVLNFINNGGNNQSYTIYVSGNIPVAGSTANTFGVLTGISVTLQGDGRLSLNSAGNLLRIAADQTLIIDSADLTLQGYSSNNTSALYITGVNAELELRNGTISSNIVSASSGTINGGGVYVTDNGIFTMYGGAVSSNRTTITTTTGSTVYAKCGGVYVTGSSSFTMYDGIISGNRAYAYSQTYWSYAYGGGVYVTESSSFTMHSGTISGNTAEVRGGHSSYARGSAEGGGVLIDNSNFTMYGGTISGNAASTTGSSYNPYAYGGGVSVTGSSVFRIVNGTVYGSSEGVLSNTVTAGTSAGAALYGSARCGTFSGASDAWVNSGNLNSTNNTINVLNGVLQ